MDHSFLLRSNHAIPAEYRANFVHLYFDIAWFGLLSGSAMAFVAVYAARQGASGFQLGLLSASPAIVNLACTLPAARWLEKQPIGSAVFWSSALHRIFYLVWIFLPGLFTPQVQIWAFIGLTLLMSIPGTALAVGFNALFADVVPPQWRSHVAGIRNALLAVTLIAVSLLCGYILNRFNFPAGYQLVFGLGFLGAALSSLHLKYVVPVSTPNPNGRAIRDRAWPGTLRLIGDSLRPAVGLRFLMRRGNRPILRTEILTGPFGRVVAVLFAIHLAQHLSIPIFPLYWVQGLHLTDYEISLGTAVFYVAVFLSSIGLAYLTQRVGNRWVVAIGAILMSTYPGLMALSQGVGLFLVASLLGGLGWSLFGGILNVYILERVPPDDRPAHLAWYNLALNAAILLGSVAGPLGASVFGLSVALAIFACCRLLAALSMMRWG
jgi:MFS family permease